MNHISLIGRLAKDPDLKYTQSGKAVCNFTLAVNRDYNREQVDFVSCQTWDKGAEIIAEYMRKGSRLAIQGRLQVRKYDQDGDTKWITEVVAEKFEFLDSKKTEKKQESGDSNFTDDSFPFE